MFNYFLKDIQWDNDLSLRSKIIDLLTRVYEGEIYDHLKYFFFQERDFSANYIPLHKRQPSVKANFCKLVVDESVSLLFGSDHFPAIVHKDDSIREKIEKAIDYYNLQELMILSATIGAVGSVCVFVRVYEGVLNLEAKNTKYLVPVFDKKNPRKIEKINEKYKVLGKVLLQEGYTNAQIKKPNGIYWFEREWDNVSETYYLPYLCNEKNTNKKIDQKRSFKHNVGFTPVIWCKNLPNVKCTIDGSPTFSQSVADSQIEFDYQMSQLGRSLKYSGDPLLVLKLQDDMGSIQRNAQNGSDGTPKIVRSSANAMVLSPEDEAELLEISGEGAKSVLAFTRTLREYIMECSGGNRSNADKVNAAQSGKAMQSMNQSLIWLSDKLRISYGHGLLIDLLTMIVDISNLPGKGICVGNEYLTNLDRKEKISLRWPNWYPDTPSDNVQTANALKTLSDASIISEDTATKVIAPNYQIDDIKKERSLISADQEKIKESSPKVSEIKNI